MGEVCFSADQAFNVRFNQVKTACENKDKKMVIYGPVHCKQTIITHKFNDSKDYMRPKCETGLIIESEVRDGQTGRDGVFLCRDYTLSPVKGTILQTLPFATRDELLLFLVLADPDNLNDQEIQKAFLDRASALKDESISKYAEFMQFFDGAVKNDSFFAYFPKGYVPEYASSPENS